MHLKEYYKDFGWLSMALNQGLAALLENSGHGGLDMSFRFERFPEGFDLEYTEVSLVNAVNQLERVW